VVILLGEMTLDEKCSLTAGANLWYLPPVDQWCGGPADASAWAKRARVSAGSITSSIS